MNVHFSVSHLREAFHLQTEELCVLTAWGGSAQAPEAESWMESEASWGEPVTLCPRGEKPAREPVKSGLRRGAHFLFSLLVK